MKLEQIPWSEEQTPGEATLRGQLEEEGYDVVRWRDRANWNYGTHSHEHDESLWVLHGRIVLRVDGNEYPLGPGDRILLPKETIHTSSVGPDGATYLIGHRREGV
ncbi:MAG: cupin domain-containing protein [Myxococcota bacterium]